MTCQWLTPWPTTPLLVRHITKLLLSTTVSQKLAIQITNLYSQSNYCMLSYAYITHYTMRVKNCAKIAGQFTVSVIVKECQDTVDEIMGDKCRGRMCADYPVTCDSQSMEVHKTVARRYPVRRKPTQNGGYRRYA